MSERKLNLSKYVWQHVLVTYRDGEQGTGVIVVTTSQNYPFRLSSGVSPRDRDELTYTECGRVLMFNESDEDIVSIRPVEKSKAKVKNNFNFEQYLCGRVRVTYRDGSQAEGRLGYSSEVTKEHLPFKFFPTDNSIDEETYTECGQVYFDGQNEKDIVMIESLNPNYSAEPGSAVEKMALALLPAVFTSLESDPNLDLAIEIAIRGTFLAMFGDDVTGETLNHSVSVIKSRISLSVKQ